MGKKANPFMRQILLAILVCCPSLAGAAQRFAVAMDDMEYFGPLSTWTNVKTAYRAVGNGVADDTAALQAGLNDLGRAKISVLYLPPGTYKISATLYFSGLANGFYGVSLIGESPSTTKIVWAGASGPPMMISNGGVATRFARLTWDGKSKAGYGVAHWWNTTSGVMYANSVEHSDEVFQDMGIGIMAGRMGAKYGNMDSEGQVRRVTFLRNTYAGLNTGSWNALDWWIWDSHFVNCARGATNKFTLTDAGSGTGAGAFHIYRSLFERSTVADVETTNTAAWFALHHNVSIGSRYFYLQNQVGANGNNVIIEGNRILDATTPAAITYGALGALMLIDNQIRSTAGTSLPAVVANDWTNSVNGWNVLSVGNKYTVANPLPATGGATNRVTSIGDATVAGPTISSALPTLPATPARVARTVFEVPRGASGAQIQAVITQAVQAAQKGAVNPVVHVPSGTYTVANTLVVPPLSRIQIVGDGWTTMVNWSGGAAPLLSLQGPSYATVRDIQLGNNTGNNLNGGITLSKADQNGGRVFIEGNRLASLFVSNLSQTQVTAQANPGIVARQSLVHPAINLSAAHNFVSVGLGGTTTINVTGGSSALIADTWTEGDLNKLHRMDSGTLTYIGGQMGPGVDGTPIDPNDPPVLLHGLNGSATFMGFTMNLSRAGAVPSGIGVQVGAETAATNILVLGAEATQTASPPNFWFKRTASGGNVGLMFAGASSAQGLAQKPNQGRTDAAFVTQMLTQLRSLTWDAAPYNAPAGSTDVRLYRIMAEQAGHILISGN